jgi:hypothetical protein
MSFAELSPLANKIATIIIAMITEKKTVCIMFDFWVDVMR